MSRTSFPCPACKVLLKTRKYIPAGKRLVCPYCDSRFSSPAELDWSQPPVIRKPAHVMPGLEAPQPETHARASGTPISHLESQAAISKLNRRFALILLAVI